MYREIGKKNMALRLSKNNKPPLDIDDILPRISSGLTVIYAQKKYKVVGFHDSSGRLILQDSQQPDDELIVEMSKVKPLLRKMDSMTNQEKEDYQEMLDGVANHTTEVWEVTEWLNSELFDYKNLIGEGLAEEL